MTSEMDRKYRTEVARLDGELAHYDRLWTQVPQFAWVALLAPVVGFMWGFAAALLEIVLSAALVGVRAYLIAMRKSEISWNRARLVSDLETSQSASSAARQLA
jgi:hypothetical protein